MSTETTNKKIKIDNGTTFGRTYTDKAVDELLKNVGGGGISVIELTDKNGTIASTQLGEINANPQNFAFKYNGKILLFTKADSTTYQYCNNTTSSSDNNVMTTSTLLTITSSTGAYTIAENVHNVVANSIHPANGGDLTNIQVGSKVYSIPSGGGDTLRVISNPYANPAETPIIPSGTYTLYQTGFTDLIYRFESTDKLYIPQLYLQTPFVAQDNTEFFVWLAGITNRTNNPAVRIMYICTKPGTLTHSLLLPEVKYYTGIGVK